MIFFHDSNPTPENSKVALQSYWTRKMRIGGMDHILTLRKILSQNWFKTTLINIWMAPLHPNEMCFILRNVPVSRFGSNNCCICDKHSKIGKNFWLPDRIFCSIFHVNKRNFFETNSKIFSPQSTKKFFDENPQPPSTNHSSSKIIDPKSRGLPTTYLNSHLLHLVSFSFRLYTGLSIL